MDSKICTACRQTLPLTEFYKKSSGRGGTNARCKKCHNRYCHEHYHGVLKHDPAYKAKLAAYSRGWHARNKERRGPEIRANHRAQREACIRHYGGKCACCGEDRYEFLAIDHVNGGGHKQRKQLGGKMCRWLVKNGFPSDPPLRVLCHNCNLAIGFYGYCPHRCSGALEM